MGEEAEKEKFEHFVRQEAEGLKARLQTFMGEGVRYALVVLDDRAAPEMQACIATSIPVPQLLTAILLCRRPGAKVP